MKISILFCLSLFLTFTSHAEDKLIGGFGLKLGDKFDLGTSIGESALTDGTPMYKFEASKEFRSFNNYYVIVTPKTHRIYSIWGIGSVENSPSCKKEQALVIVMV